MGAHNRAHLIQLIRITRVHDVNGYQTDKRMQGVAAKWTKPVSHISSDAVPCREPNPFIRSCIR